ncbi:nudix hydrolase 26 [Pyrus ussuriensis x Pyrus communis]|uniref:Nudix hydrolase 26 n=1 Tax=Pyrus ussuriensis x Pyrus communis TaxID=2448454 RepID=A0A5N5GWU2_9ROSA|nr:nudix hydrolase 26 [Pyrus ussuriensis x Pyrus communis]
MSNSRRNMVKMPPVQSSAKKSKVETIKPTLDWFGQLRRPREWAGPWLWAAGLTPGRLTLGLGPSILGSRQWKPLPKVIEGMLASASSMILRSFIKNCFGKGGIDEAEDPRSAAIREIREETGVKSAEILAEAPYWLTYDFPPEVREKLRHQWGSDWKDQAQKWFLLKFTGKDDEINLLGDGSEKPGFGEWSWMSTEQVVDLTLDFKKPVYKEVLAAFTPHLP